MKHLLEKQLTRQIGKREQCKADMDEKIRLIEGEIP
jgi:hypothetical protein